MMMTARMGSLSGPSWLPTPGPSTPEASGHWRSSSLTVLRSPGTSWTGPCSFTEPRRRPTPASLCPILTPNWRLSRKLMRIERKCKINHRKWLIQQTVKRTSLNKRKNERAILYIVAKNNLNVQPTSVFVVCIHQHQYYFIKRNKSFAIVDTIRALKAPNISNTGVSAKSHQFNNPTTRLLNFQL